MLCLWGGTSGPLVSWNRVVGDLAHRHSVTAPAALERPRVHVIYEDTLPVDDVDLAGVLVEVEAALGREDVGLLIVFLERRRAFGRPVVEVPHELPVLRELEDAVLRPGSGQ